MGLFGNLFDFNGDGNLDALESAVEYGMFMNIVDSDQEDALQSAGIDINELDMMDDDERQEALEGAGLDPDDYEFCGGDGEIRTRGGLLPN